MEYSIGSESVVNKGKFLMEFKWVAPQLELTSYGFDC
jgi:hypothetical protein